MPTVASRRRSAIGPGTALLILLNLGLAGLVAALALLDLDPLLRWLVERPAPSLATADGGTATRSDGVRLPVSRIDRRGPGALDQTLARPLFREDRRPPVAPPPELAAPETRSAAPAAPPERSPPPQVSLVGVVTLPDGTGRALLRPEGQTRGVWLSAGERIDGWRLVLVGRTEIALVRDGERHVLALRPPGNATP